MPAYHSESKLCSQAPVAREEDGAPSSLLCGQSGSQRSSRGPSDTAVKDLKVKTLSSIRYTSALTGPGEPGKRDSSWKGTWCREYRSWTSLFLQEPHLRAAGSVPKRATADKEMSMCSASAKQYLHTHELILRHYALAAVLDLGRVGETCVGGRRDSLALVFPSCDLLHLRDELGQKGLEACVGVLGILRRASTSERTTSQKRGGAQAHSDAGVVRMKLDGVLVRKMPRE